MPNRSNKIIFTILILLLILVYVVFYKPFRTSIVDLQTKISQVTVENAELSEKVKAFDELKLSIPDLLEERKRILLTVPSDLSQEQLIVDLSKISNARGISLGNINFSLGKLQNTDNIGTITMTTNFEGTYQDLLKFLSDIESNERVINVKNVSLQLKDGSGNLNSQAFFNLTLESYYQI